MGTAVVGAAVVDPLVAPPVAGLADPSVVLGNVSGASLEAVPVLLSAVCELLRPNAK